MTHDAILPHDSRQNHHSVPTECSTRQNMRFYYKHLPYAPLTSDTTHESSSRRRFGGGHAPNPKPGTNFPIRRARRFVNRKKELAHVQQVVEEIRRGSHVQECLINFHGIPGMGISALLAQISDLCSNNRELVLVELDLEQVFKSVGGSVAQAQLKFLQAVAAEFSYEHANTIQEQIQLGDEEALNVQLTDLANCLVERQQRICLIFDAWDRVVDSLARWIEQILLLPLIKTERVLAIFGSQVELRWWQLDVRRRTKSYVLSALEKKDTREQIGCTEEQSNIIQTISFGYPLANEYIYEQLQQIQDVDHYLQTQQASLTQHLLHQLRTYLDNSVSNELYRIMIVMTLFREFDVHTLRAILPQFYPEFKARSQSSLMLSIKELLATRLVAWDDIFRAYAFNSTIRLIYAKALELNDPATYDTIRNAALTYYEEAIRDVPMSRSTYLVEYCYHTLYKRSNNSYQEGVEDQRAVDSKRKLREYLEQFYQFQDGKILAERALITLRATLLGDVEIQSVLTDRRDSPKALLSVVEEFIQHHQSKAGRTPPDR